MDLKKFRKSSSKKFIKGSLGFFLSPREDGKYASQESSIPVKDIPGITNLKKSNDWGRDSLKPYQNNIDDHERDFIDDIPAIPSLDDFPDDFSKEIAKAPMFDVKQVATYKELENDILKNSMFTTFEGINFEILIKGLHPDSFLNESDVPWSQESLFYDIVSKINQRKL